MNATTKKLLSWLIVLTMVLSMVPALDLSNFAVTTKAETYVNPGADVIEDMQALRETFAGATETVTAVCPVCSRLTQENDQENAITDAVEWLPLSGEALETLSFEKEDSKITHNHYYLSGDATFASTGVTFTGGNNHKFCLNLNGKNLTAGDSVFNSSYGNVLNLMDSAETEGTMTGYKNAEGGAAININNKGAVVNIYGGTLKKITSDEAKLSRYSSVVFIGTNGGTVNVYGGTVDGTKSAEGYDNDWRPTAVTARAGAFNMYGGTIIGGTSVSDGGAILVDAAAAFNLYDGTVKDGIGRAGGNFLVTGGTLNVYGGTIENGKASTSTAILGGGNIFFTTGGTLHMEGGVISGGSANTFGGNIGVRDQDSYYATVEISGGKIIGGTAPAKGANIYLRGGAANKSALTVSGGEISGDIATDANTDITLSGAPVIKGGTSTGLVVTGETSISVSGVTGGEIQVTAALGTVFGADAADAAEYFSCTTAATKVVANAEGKLEIVERAVDNDVFEPWAFNGQAYCPACQEVKTWTAIDSTEDVDGKVLTGHCYLSTDITDSTLSRFVEIGNGNLCFNLNGKDLTMTNGRAFHVNRAYTLNILDTAGTAVVTGFAKGNSGAVIHVNATSNSVNTSAAVNIYGGTFKKSIGTVGVDAVSGATDSRRSAIIYLDSYGTVTMYGGTIDAAELNTPDTQNQIYPLAVLLRGGAYKAIFEMKGGTIIGGNSTGDGGLIRVGMPGTSNTNVAAFKMTGGTIYGGGVFTDARGGNIYVEKENSLEISGGVIVGDIYATSGAKVTLSGAAKIVKELTVGEQTVLAKRTGLHIASTDVAVDISGLTEGAEVYIEGALDTALITAENAETLKDCIKAFEGTQYAYVKDNAFYLAQAKASVVSNVQTGYATVAEALAAYYADGEGAYIKLLADAEIALTQAAYIDANGYAVTVSGTGTLCAMDASNDDYDGCAEWTVAEGITVESDVTNLVNGRRYILIENENGTYGAHRITMDLTHVTLSTAKAGIYYKATYKCDDVLAANVGEYGVVLSVAGGSEFSSVLEAEFTPDEEHAVYGASTEVYGIFKSEGRTNEENTAIGELAISATPYITVAGEKIVEKEIVEKSLLDVMLMIDEAWENTEGFVLTDDEKTQVQEFYNTWKDLGMSAWAEKLPNISAEA